jgi:fatty acid desaturase
MTPDTAIRQMLREHLPKDFGKRDPRRLGWLLLALLFVSAHLLVVRAALKGDAYGWWMIATLPAAVTTWPYFLFVLHELGHGALLPRGPVRFLASAFAAYPILLQPTFWSVVHNHHHKYVNQEEDHDRRRIAGRGEVGERLYEYELDNPWIIFSLVCAIHAVYYGQLWAFLTEKISFNVTRGRVLIELAGGLLFAVGLAWFLGWRMLIVGWLPYALVGSTLQSLYLISNHLTRPMVAHADSLNAGVSVELLHGWSHMDFGRHVEHHLFPYVPGNQLKSVTILLRRIYPDRFREGTLIGIVQQLLKLPGYYLTYDVLTDRTGTKRVRID